MRTTQTKITMDEALDALESMCFQYLSKWDEPDGKDLSHAFMSVGEDACALLCRVRPDRWEANGYGMRYVGPPWP